MNGTWKEEAFASALRGLGEGAPKDLVKRAQIDAEERDSEVTAADLTTVLIDAGPGSPFLSALGMMVHKWDAAHGSHDWVQGTTPSSVGRRALICGRLGLDDAGAQCLLEKRPIFHDETVVITQDWERWYTPERQVAHAFYWPHYRDYLAQNKHWDSSNIVALDRATTDVVERLADPLRQEAYQAKGLVVGYVQSGKTANITGVIAKAIDAGYRLVIVMTGTIELLRSQTQRRLDMEMVGQQNIRGEASSDDDQHRYDYEDDDDWREGRFLDLGASPLPLEIQRLTQHKADYTNLENHFMNLRMERLVASKALYHPDNIFSSRARLAVVKKNAAVLRKIVQNIKANRSAFAEIPVLIIDDESDEASINVVDPEKVKRAKSEGKEVRDRTAINAQIAAMLGLMPRAQYVGYTATPFANVFADPDDDLGIFPKDFLIGLPKPPGYMGLEDFLDQSPAADGASATLSNEAAHVRKLEAADDDSDMQADELREAIDAFVLTGAMKLHRQSVGAGTFRHHTMLVHQDVRKASHRDLADLIKEEVWPNASYTSSAGLARLRDLYERDIKPVAAARHDHLQDGIPEPPAFADLRPFIAKAVGRISEHSNNPVIVVNSDKEIEQQRLDFDKGSTWRILVGGAKLSRGFTVEGLTVTYFRRATDINATLMQMGRWFGFRQGFRDLVRLYIARRARFGKREMDLYDAFVGIALDESAFREQLRLYSGWEGDKPRLIPSQIPPLVAQHLPWLRPVARNKMFNAVLVEQHDQPFTPTGYGLNPSLLWNDLDAWRTVLASADLTKIGGAGGARDFTGRVALIDAARFVRLVEAMHFIEGYFASTVNPKLEHYRRRVADGSLKDLLLVMPELTTEPIDLTGIGRRHPAHRERREDRGGLFGEVTDPKHRPALDAFVDRTATAPDGLEQWRSEGRGAILMYVVKETAPPYGAIPPSEWGHAKEEFGVLLTLSAYLPAELASRYRGFVRFSVRRPGTDDPTVDVV